MKSIFFINDTIENKISFYHLAFFLALLPYDFFYSELVLISFALHTVIHIKRSDFRNVISKPMLVLVSVYLLNLLAILYSANKQEGLGLAVRQLGLLLFPVLFSLSHLDFAKYRMRLISIFGFSCVLTVIYLYYDAIKTIFVFHLPLSSLFTVNFMNHNFSLPVGIHATYLSMYIAFSIIALLRMIVREEAKMQKLIYILAAVILFAGLIQLSSRAVFFAFLLIINLVFPFVVFTGRKRQACFFITAFISIAVMLLIYSVDSFKTRYVSELKTDLTDNVKIIENTEPRLARWEAIMELVESSPVIGYGSGAETGLLQEKYFQKGLYISYLNEFNTHNQYLATLLKTGIAGLLLFLFTLFYGYAAAIKRRDLFLLSFMVMVSVIALSENILELNKGIFFYGFFFSILLLFPEAGAGGNRHNVTDEPGNPARVIAV
ncbi:MAG: O-antigen ligase family protein [Ferruginibacter sp.]|nr:O-antigen ligase family protein [Ferruginibacter sp.]